MSHLERVYRLYRSWGRPSAEAYTYARELLLPTHEWWWWGRLRRLPTTTDNDYVVMFRNSDEPPTPTTDND